MPTQAIELIEHAEPLPFNVVIGGDANTALYVLRLTQGVDITEPLARGPRTDGTRAHGGEPDRARRSLARRALRSRVMAASTMVSDLVLALACMVGALWSLRHGELTRRYAAVGMGLMAAAAVLGSARFAGVDAITPAHRWVSYLAGAIAPGCFALVALAVARRWSRRFVELGLLALGLGLLVFDRLLGLSIYSTAIGTLAVVIMIGVGVHARSRAGGLLLAGALLLALAGLVIGSTGSFGPLLRVDVFHVALAVAHLLIARGLVELQQPRA